MTILVKVDEARIDDLLRGPKGEVASTMLFFAQRTETLAKRLCPVDTGRLRGSITHTRVFNRQDVLVVRIGSAVRYARFVHQGTRHTRGRPFLSRALAQQRRR